MLIRLFQQAQNKNAWPYWLLAFAVLMLPIVSAPFYSDDFFHLLLLGGSEHLQRDMQGSVFGLFAFIDANPQSAEQMRQYSVLPWWAEPGFYFRFWRPVAEISHYIDFALFPKNAFVAHLHSVLLFVLLAFLFYRLTKLVAKEQSQAFLWLALVIFIFDGQHVATIAWVANRNALLAGVFGLLCVISYCQYNQGQGKKYYCLSLLMLPLALLSAEAALAIPAYLFCYTLYYRNKLTFISLVPPALITITWLLLHQYLGYGAEPSGNAYTNPAAHPWVFVQRLFERLPVYLFSQMTSSPAGAYWTIEGWLPGFKKVYLIGALVILPLFIYWLIPALKTSKFLRFSFLAMVLTALPACLANPQDRLSLMQSIASAWLFAGFMLYCYKYQRRFILALMIIGQLVVSPLHLFFGGLYLNVEARSINHALQHFDKNNSIAGKKIILFDVPVGYNVMLTGVRAVNNKPLPEALLYLGNSEGGTSFSQVDAKTLRINRKQAFGSGFESAFRALNDKGFKQGQVVSHPVANIVVEKLDAQNLPMQIRLEFEEPYRSSDYQFYQYIDGKLQQVFGL